MHEAIASRSGLIGLVHHEEADFVLDVLAVDGRPVSERTGLR
ncbi:hypothetical protein [Frondihabitans sucicola]|nr:hypothetical protein [Frondihabitans sucicola]